MKVKQVTAGTGASVTFLISIGVGSKRQAAIMCQTLNQLFAKDESYSSNENLIYFRSVISRVDHANIEMQVSNNYSRSRACSTRLIEIGMKIQELLTASNMQYG